MLYLYVVKADLGKIGPAGSPDILLEVVPISGDGPLAPRNQLLVTRKGADLAAKLLVFATEDEKTSTTDQTDDEIISQGM